MTIKPEGGMGKTVPRLDKRVADSTRDWEWKKQESFALVSKLAVDCKCAIDCKCAK
jgi:hypothetical protein